jgi:hypothetical protein
MPKLSPLPRELGERPFSTGEASRLGVLPSRLRSRDLHAPFRGVRVPAASSSELSAPEVYAAIMPKEQFFSHITAARLHGLRLPDDPILDEMHVSVWKPNRAPRVSGVVGHALTSGKFQRVVELDVGFRVTDVVSTWCALAPSLPLDQLIMVGDSVVRRVKPLAAITDLRAAVLARSGQRGAKKLREALELVRSGTDSRRETQLRLAIVRAGLPEPEVNAVIRNSYGAQIALGDLVFRRSRVLVEYDGGHHQSDLAQYLHDVDRLNDVAQEAWQVVRINKSHMRLNAYPAIARIRAALSRAALSDATLN